MTQSLQIKNYLDEFSLRKIFLFMISFYNENRILYKKL